MGVESVGLVTGGSGWRDGGVMDGGVMGGTVVDGGMNGGGVAGTSGVAGVAGQERGESRRSSISFCPRSSFASFRRLLTRLAGGDATTGGDGGGGVEVFRGGVRHRLGQRQ